MSYSLPESWSDGLYKYKRVPCDLCGAEWGNITLRPERAEFAAPTVRVCGFCWSMFGGAIGCVREFVRRVALRAGVS